MMLNICFAFLAILGAGTTCFFIWRCNLLNMELNAQSEAAISEQVSSDPPESLKLVRQENEALLTSCGVGVLLITTEKIVHHANQTARYHLGIPTVSMVGKSVLQGTLSTEFNDLVRSAQESRCLQRREIRAAGSSGCLLMVTAYPMLDEESTSCRILLITHDVTELRRLEMIRRDFVGNVSHELRTPLASICAMAETLKDGALNDPSVSDRFLKIIITEAQRLTRISDDLLTLSRAESQPSPMSGFNLYELFEEIVSHMQQQADRAGVRLVLEIPREITVHANLDQIEQVLVNLLDNAIKYTPNGGSVRLTAERNEKHALIHVMDTGIGILSEDIPRIFERFYRVDKARSRQSGGTGLGLSIVKHIVEAHSGEVSVDSVYNRGSTFSFSLPISNERVKK